MSPFDLVIRGGTLVDGSGAAARAADIGVLGDRIAAIGDLRSVTARHPAGIEQVVVNGVAAVRDGVETGRRPGRLLRRDG